MAGNFLLIDVEDEMAYDLIYATGPDVIGKEIDQTSGWYTPSHYNKIRALLDHRMATLTKTGMPASRESCMALLEGRTS